MIPWPKLSVACWLAGLAYQSQDSARLALAAMEMTLVQWVDEPTTDTHGFLATTKDGILVWSFRGTSSKNNLLIDLDAMPEHVAGFPWCLHAGFHKAYAAARPLWNYDLISSYPLLIVGHSLGGALATLAACDVQAGGLPLAVRTFGSPRVGDQDFVDAFNKRVPDCIRVRHDEDLVPTVPGGFGYEHVKTLLHLNDDGTEVGKLAGFWERLWELDRQTAADIDGQAVRNHFLDQYQATIYRFEVRNIT